MLRNTTFGTRTFSQALDDCHFDGTAPAPCSLTRHIFTCCSPMYWNKGLIHSGYLHSFKWRVKGKFRNGGITDLYQELSIYSRGEASCHDLSPVCCRVCEIKRMLIGKQGVSKLSGVTSEVFQADMAGCRRQGESLADDVVVFFAVVLVVAKFLSLVCFRTRRQGVCLSFVCVSI